MENSSNSTQNNEVNSHPKPTDDVQMEIETVIPENEKEGLPNDQEHNHRSVESSTDPGSSKMEKSADVPEASGADNLDESGDSAENSEIAEEGSDNNESGDKRDDVETTSV